MLDDRNVCFEMFFCNFLHVTGMNLCDPLMETIKFIQLDLLATVNLIVTIPDIATNGQSSDANC